MSTCATCRFWDALPPQYPGNDEHLCRLSKWMSFGAYGQDGKAIITAPEFGCVKWRKLEPEPKQKD